MTKYLDSYFDIAADLDTAAGVFLKLRPLRPRCLLESVVAGTGPARYSYIVLGDCEEWTLGINGLRMAGHCLPRPADGTQLLSALRAGLARLPQLQPHIPGLPFSGGLLGASSYEMVRYFEPQALSGAPLLTSTDAYYLAPRSVLIFDHATRSMALLHAGAEHERQALRREIVRALRHREVEGVRRARCSPPIASLDAASFMQGVVRAQNHIKAGDVYQLVLSIQFTGCCALPPFAVYRALRRLNPSPYMFYCELGDRVLVGASPEALVKLEHNRAQLRPIAGTYLKPTEPAQVASQQAALLADPKENAEHVMLVDLARNDLGRVARPGSIVVAPYRHVEHYSHVMHLVSGVSGELAAGMDGFDLFAAAFPAGTLVGAPKVRAMQLIAAIEPVPRGFYGGALGYFSRSADGACRSMDQAIAIRTLQFHGDTYTLQAGAGVVAASNPAREYEEVLAKSAVLRAALLQVQEGV